MLALKIIVKGEEIATNINENKASGTEAGLLVCELERIKLKLINSLQEDSDEFTIEDGEE
jgi:hypothetical protein